MLEAYNLRQIAFENYFCTANILTEIALVMLPSRIVWGLQLSIKKKATIMLCFAGRLLYESSFYAHYVN